MRSADQNIEDNKEESLSGSQTTAASERLAASFASDSLSGS